MKPRLPTSMLAVLMGLSTTTSSCTICRVIDEDGGIGEPCACEESSEPSGQQPAWYQPSFRIDATSGAAGGPGSVRVRLDALNDHEQPFCLQLMTFDADYAHGAAQGPDLWGGIDEVVQWQGEGTALGNTCWWSTEQTFGEPWPEHLGWMMNPLAFVSCQTIEADVALAAVEVGADPLGLAPGATTLGALCSQMDPLLVNEGYGHLEAIWLLGYPEDFNSYWYTCLAPENVDHVACWYFGGYLVRVDAEDGSTGLDGVYETITGWGVL
jgi:hypothetical protein